MVAGRAAQGKGAVLAIQQLLHPGQRQVGTGAHRRPGASRDGNAGIHGVKAQLAIDMFVRYRCADRAPAASGKASC
jgi:hypothetical protein